MLQQSACLCLPRPEHVRSLTGWLVDTVDTCPRNHDTYLLVQWSMQVSGLSKEANILDKVYNRLSWVGVSVRFCVSPAWSIFVINSLCVGSPIHCVTQASKTRKQGKPRGVAEVSPWQRVYPTFIDAGLHIPQSQNVSGIDNLAEAAGI